MKTLEEINAEIVKVEEVIEKKSDSYQDYPDFSYEKQAERQADIQLLQRRLTSLYCLRWYLDENAKSLSEL